MVTLCFRQGSWGCSSLFYPVLSGIWLSLQSLYLLESPNPHWIGLADTVRFAQDPLFFYYWRNSFIWALGSLTGR